MTPQQYAPLIAVAVMLPIILLRNRRPRRLRPERMRITPLVVLTLIGFGIWGLSMAPGASHEPFGVTSWIILAVALLLGAGAGWWRGKMTTIEKVADGTLSAQASPLGLILIVGLLLSRQALRPWVESQAATWHVNALAIQDAFMVFVIGMILMQRLEMFLRARRVMAGGTDDHVEAVA